MKNRLKKMIDASKTHTHTYIYIGRREREEEDEKIRKETKKESPNYIDKDHKEEKEKFIKFAVHQSRTSQYKLIG